MRRLIEFFDQTYIINLRDRPDRRRQVVREFDRIGLKIPNAKVSFYTADRYSEAAGFPSAGVRGSFSSHQRVLELALHKNARNVLVVEDDVFFKHVSISHERAILDFLHKDNWDLIYLGYLEPDEKCLTGPIDKWDGNTIGGHFYGVNREFMAKMAGYMDKSQKRPPGSPLGGPTFRDGAYNQIRKACTELRVFLSAPNLAVQRSSRTDLLDTRFYDRVKIFRPALESVRQIKNILRRR